MDIDLKGRVAAVTHATTPTGRAIAEALGRAGAVLCLGADDETAAAQIVAELHEKHLLAEGWAVSPDSVEGASLLVSEAQSRFDHLDIWVNTHVLTPSVAAESLGLDDFVRGLNVNLDAMFFGCQAATRYMFAQKPKGGVIINVTSAAGVVAVAGHAAFCAAMAGVTASTKTLAVEWGAEGVRVVGLGTGITTEMAAALSVQPMLPDGVREAQRRLPPMSLASSHGLGEAAVYLASDAAKHINGMTLYVDGGWLSDGYWE